MHTGRRFVKIPPYPKDKWKRAPACFGRALFVADLRLTLNALDKLMRRENAYRGESLIFLKQLGGRYL